MKKGILIDVEKREIKEVVIEDTLDSIYEQIKCDTFDCVQIHEENDVYVDDVKFMDIYEVQLLSKMGMF